MRELNDAVRAAVLWLALAAAGCASMTGPAAAATVSGTSVAWLPAAGDADIDRAFAQARSERKPVLLYRGATWCPPCNQLKARLFNRRDFVDRAQTVVPVAIDGDSAGAQKLGERFKAVGYPTLTCSRPTAARSPACPARSIRRR